MKSEDYENALKEEKRALKFVKAEAKANDLKYIGSSVSTNRHYTVTVYSFTDGTSTMEIDAIQLYGIRGPAKATKLLNYENAKQIESKTKPIQKHEKVVEKLKEMDAYCTFCKGVIDTVYFPIEDRLDQILLKLQKNFSKIAFLEDNQDITMFDAAFMIEADIVPSERGRNKHMYPERSVFFAVGVNV